jgi:GH15 family glucan-1,4-alpha-glucosidase
MTAFMPLRSLDGYLPIEDHGLIGDGTTSALVGRDGAVVWLCVPRFDSAPLFCRILDAARGGAFTLAPEEVVESRQLYAGDTGILVTELRGRAGLLRVTDALTLHSGADLTEDAPGGRGELLRVAEVLHGPLRLHIKVAPRGGAEASRWGNGLRLQCNGRPDLALHLSANIPLDGMETTRDVQPGERVELLLRWGAASERYRPATADVLLEATRGAWLRWLTRCSYAGPQQAPVRRAAITLKLLDYWPNGAIVAAPTSSLPAPIGGVRNWDYRYTWIRDAAFSAYAFHRIGLTHEAGIFLRWVLDAAERHRRPCVLYSLDGGEPAPEWEDPELEGYRGSRPVRWGNGAADQIQHDVYGEILDCAYQWARHHGALDAAIWAKLCNLVEAARREWRQPDHGIWEARTPGRPYTYSAALCQVALDRGVRLAEQFGLPADLAGWRADAAMLRETILDTAWNPRLNALTEHLGGGGLDASLLSLPLRRLIRADDPRMVATTRAIVDGLGAGGGLLYRYLPTESPDGLPGEEGAFLLCSFWLVDNLAMQGRLDEAMALYDSLCSRASPLGLLPEQIDPATGAFMGNYPQAFSQIGVISSGINLARLSQAPGA